MSKLIILLFIVLLPVHREQAAILDTRLTIKIYAAEILESVISRLGQDTGYSISYDVWMLSPYKAKARNYNNSTIKAILDDQLKGTPIRYRVRKEHLEIYKPLIDSVNP